MPQAPTKPKYFATLDAWRAWLATHQAEDKELGVGFWKRGSGKPSITWPESVDGALAYGWIDGVRKSLGAHAYVIRFTPRRSGSIWSAVNIRRVATPRDPHRLLQGAPTPPIAHAAREEVISEQHM